MKTSKFLISIIVATVIVFAMGVSAFCIGPETFTITVNNPKEGHTYQAYRIFSGKVSENTLSDIAWGDGITEEGITAIQTDYSAASAKEVAEKLNDGNSAEFAAKVSAYLKSTAVHESTFDSMTHNYKISNLESGYYLIKDKEGTLAGSNDAYTDFIIKVVGDSTVTPKSSVPSVEKKVKDINDSVESSLTDWQDSADYDIGDDVPFLLKATLGDNLTGYDTYKLVFRDTLSAGLTFNPDSTVVKIDGTSLGASYYTKEYSGTALTFTISDVIAKGASANSVVTVEYTAKLNENAVIGSTGNPNTVYLEYSNNPHSEAETGKTPEDKVIVFTYQITVNKTDGTNPLKNAGFTLYKKNPGGSFAVVGSELKGTDMTEFTWKGIDDGVYRIVETTTPPGYNTVEPIEFTVTAVHDVTADNPTLTELSGGVKFSGTVETGALVTEVVNHAGHVLPGTGGSGTTLFYIIGGVLLATAVIILIAKKRTNDTKQ